MGRAAARREYYEEKDAFEEGHIPLVWDELEERFGVNVKRWKEKFNKAFLEQPHAVSRVEFFRRFLIENFNNHLNHILCRNSYHGTINSLLDYVAKRGIR